MSKFKVGDRVRLRHGDRREGTITSIGSSGNDRFFRLDGAPDGWLAERLLLVEAAKPVFKPGDRVRVIDADPFWGLHRGNEHIVAEYRRSLHGSDFVTVQGNDTEFFVSRFELVAESRQEDGGEAVPAASEKSGDVREYSLMVHCGTFVKVLAVIGDKAWCRFGTGRICVLPWAELEAA